MGGGGGGGGGAGGGAGGGGGGRAVGVGVGVEAGIGIFCNHLVVNSSAPRGKIAFFYGCWAIISLLGGGGGVR